MKAFAPGCALMIYKPHLAEKILALLNEHAGGMEMINTCCKHQPSCHKSTIVINVCPGCDKRFRNDYEDISTLSLWEVLAEGDFFHFPDYKGKTMSIIDACPTREQTTIHRSIRILLEKMNITLVEPERTGIHGTCCGDTFYGTLPTSKVKEQMKKRTAEMPAEDVVVYCISCTKSVFIGGKTPHYLVDLLFGEDTIPKTLEPDDWHKELQEYIDLH
jgi:Fe-S oxidoreductase